MIFRKSYIKGQKERNQPAKRVLGLAKINRKVQPAASPIVFSSHF